MIAIFKKQKLIVLLAVSTAVFLFLSCASFIEKNQEKELKDLENELYTLKQDTGEDKRFLKKGEKVKLIVITNENYVKIYCYPASGDLLKDERTLLVYMFQDDFKDKKIDLDLIREELDKKAEKIKSNIK